VVFASPVRAALTWHVRGDSINVWRCRVWIHRRIRHLPNGRSLEILAAQSLISLRFVRKRQHEVIAMSTASTCRQPSRIAQFVVLGLLSVWMAPTASADEFFAIGDDAGRIYTAVSNGDGTFGTLTQIDDRGSNARGAAIADFDGDGNLDGCSSGSPRQAALLVPPTGQLYMSASSVQPRSQRPL